MVNTAQTIQLWCWSSSSTVESWVVITLGFISRSVSVRCARIFCMCKGP